MIKNEKNLHNDTISAVFVLAFLAIQIIATFIIGFNLPIYIITMLLAGTIALTYPRSGLYAAIFATFIFERFFTLQPILIGRTEYKLYPLDIILAAVIAGALYQVFIGKIRVRFMKIDILPIIFSALALVYFIFSLFDASSNFAISFSSFKNYVFYSLFYFLILILINSKEHLIRFIKFIFAGAIGIVFFIIYGILNGTGLWTEYTPLSTEGTRILAFTHAYYISMALLSIIIYLVSEKLGNFKRYFPMILIFILGIAGSMMRHLWISLFLSLAVMYFVLPIERRLYFRQLFYKFFMVLIIAGIFIFNLVIIFDSSRAGRNATDIVSRLSERAASITDASDESISWRGVVWKEAMRAYLKNPITGIGFGKNIYIESGNYRDFVEVRNIHNSFLVVFVQMGIVGLGILIALIASLIKKLIQKKHPDDSLNIMRLAVLAVLLFQVTAFLFQPYLEANLLGMFFWIVLGLSRILAYENLRNQ